VEDRRPVQVTSRLEEPYLDKGPETAVDAAAEQAVARHLAAR